MLLACAGYLVSLVAHGRFHQDDFRAYRMASGAFVAGQPLYFVTGPESPFLYRYAPPVALAFAPFRLVPAPVAAFAWYAIDALLVVALWRLLRRLGVLRPAWAVLFFTAVGVTLERELGVGNVNLLNLVACLAAIGWLERGGSARAGALLAWATLAKPPNALLLLPLARRRPALLLPWAACTLVLLALPLPFYGVAGTLALYGAFVRSLADFQQLYGDTFKYHATTAGLLERAGALAGLHAVPRLAFQALGLLAALAALAAAERRARPTRVPLLVAMALVPLSATADANVFVFAAPLVWWLLRARQGARWPLWANAWLAGALVLFGGNWHDLWGRTLSVRFADLGLHGLGTWLLIALALCAPAGASEGTSPSSQRVA